MPNSLLVMTNAATGGLLVLHVDEIRSIEHGEGKTKVLTHGGLRLAEDPLGSIMEQYYATSVPEFIAESCDACAAIANAIAPAITIPKASPSLQDFIDKNLSVRATNIAEAAFPCPLPSGVDCSTIPLGPILAITEAQWAERPNSNATCARQIVQALTEVVTEHNTRIYRANMVDDE